MRWIAYQFLKINKRVGEKKKTDNGGNENKRISLLFNISVHNKINTIPKSFHITTYEGP
jgi:hypothetical protein